ncbi:hypothetical protein D7D52_14655 [Nocardia yunnanensis]|uniref:Sigma 54 modulation/S30EA ribosomal protein C-terminal domain-containing protein n=1 Tax=Nocardia yunnanensis TaxID=2382165 RepID=A0A386ZC63_9NOCA|nr:sigma 54 modulation/S30EA ribosomal C-terminal domain-containing protein [Nocardia yunnanensis]AYF74897.1 hypothetical protein D7D52_14655 [Nocardia yunnanensis]
MAANETGQVAVTVRGPVPATEAQRAEGVIGRVLQNNRVDGVAWTRLTGPRYAGGPTVAQVDVSVHGLPVRAQADGPGSFALTLVAERLDRQLRRILSADHSRWWVDAGRRPLAYPGPTRPITRRKTCRLRLCHPATAVAAMDAADYDAHLFTDRETGEDAIVYWAGPLGIRLARQRNRQAPRLSLPMLDAADSPATPTHTERQAAIRLCRYGLPFLFYTDPYDGRGRLLYRRYDGDLALLIPSGSSAPLSALSPADAPTYTLASTHRRGGGHDL